jgi:hypothetical protein
MYVPPSPIPYPIFLETNQHNPNHKTELDIPSSRFPRREKRRVGEYKTESPYSAEIHHRRRSYLCLCLRLRLRPRPGRRYHPHIPHLHIPNSSTQPPPSPRLPLPHPPIPIPTNPNPNPNPPIPNRHPQTNPLHPIHPHPLPRKKLPRRVGGDGSVSEEYGAAGWAYAESDTVFFGG